jgi:hypothetical protein
MACIACFIDDLHQKELKKQCFDLDRFESKLLKYKELYIDEFKTLVSVSNCNCNYKNTNQVYIKWTNDFLQNMQSNITLIERTFDELKDIYISYIAESNKIAIDKIWRFLQQNNLIRNSESPLSYSNLLFRAREDKGTFDKKDIKSFFHIPFDKRILIGNQRFSISGQPMLYFSNSVIGLEKELSTPIDKLSIAGFLPIYSKNYDRKFYEIKNSLFDVLVKNLPEIVNSGIQINYYNGDLTPNYNSIIQDVQKSILSQILTFPVKNKNNFVEEYVLPQMLTSALLDNNYDGVIFPSTKDFKNLNGHHIFSEHEVNIAIYATYSPKDRYDNNLLKTFFQFTFNGSEKLNYTVKDITDRFELIFDKNKKPNQNNNDFIIPLSKAKLHIEYLEKSLLNGTKYYDNLHGKIELEFFMKMADKLEKYVK